MKVLYIQTPMLIFSVDFYKLIVVSLASNYHGSKQL